MDRATVRAAVELLRDDPGVDPAVVASQIGDAETAAEALAYLCGHLIEMNARAAGTTPEIIIERLARLLGGPGPAGVREPRRPTPPSGPTRADPGVSELP